MKKHNALMTWFSFVLASSVLMAFAACQNNSSNPQTEAGARIIRIDDNSLANNGILSAGVYGTGTANLRATIQDDNGQVVTIDESGINATSPINSTASQLGNLIYSTQSICENATCSGVAMVLVAYPAYSNGTGPNQFLNGYNNMYNGTTNISTVNGVQALYEKAYLFRRDISNHMVLVGRVNGNFNTVMDAVPSLEASVGH